MRIALLAFAVAISLTALAQADSPVSRSSPRAGLLAELEFDVDSTTLHVTTREQIGQVAAWALANPDGVLVVEGHADRAGSDAYNVQLSLDRATAVRAELIDAHVPPEQIIVAAFGERGPVRGDNRRVAVWAMRAAPERVAAAVRALRPSLIDTGRGAVGLR